MKASTKIVDQRKPQEEGEITHYIKATEVEKIPNVECTAVYLHTAIMIDGKTESTLTKGKVPTIKSMEWTPDFTALIIKARTTHCLPSAAIKDSIILL